MSNELVNASPDQLPAAPQTPATWMTMAIESGRGADEIATLAAVYEKWEKDQARKAYNVALAACQDEMPVIVKDRQGDKGKYATFENVQQKAKPIYMKHGFRVSISEGPREGDTICVRAKVSHNDGHEEIFERFGNVDDKGPKGNPVKTPLQGAQSAVSYLSRTLICGIFNLVIADTDKDGAGEMAVITPQQRKVLHDLIIETNTDLNQFLKYGGVDELALFPESKYQQALVLLRKKVGK